MADFDLAIVGAGIAGLTAAVEAERFGLKAVVLEAGGRTGGRAFTESASLGVPFDHGCHFLHAASKNPFLPIAGALGFHYRRCGYKQGIHADGRWFSAAEVGRYLDWVTRYFSALPDLPGPGGEVSVEHATKHLKRWGNLFDGYYEEFLGAPASDVGLLEHSRYVDTFEDWPVREGFGSLVARHFRRVRARVECRVRHVSCERAGVVVESDCGRVSARAALITVSTGVLAAEQIRFSPPLPMWKLRAIEALPMGYAGKVAFRLSDAPDVLEPMHVLAGARDGTFANVHIRPFGAPVIVVIVGGRHWKAIELAGPRAMIAAARDRVAELLGASVVRRLDGGVATSWQTNPHIAGGHSYRVPGDPEARRRLGAPLRGRVFFAGEATSTEAWATAHGAYQSGIRAIDEIIDAFKSATRRSRRCHA